MSSRRADAPPPPRRRRQNRAMTDLSLARHIGAILARAGADLDPAETAEWCEALDALTAAHGPARARFLLDALLAHARRRGVHWQPSLITPYVNTIPLEDAAAVPRRPGDGAAPRRADALERAGDGDARQPRRERRLGRARRPHRELRLGGRSVRGRLQPLLPRPRRRAGDGDARRPRLLPAALGARRLRARLPRRPPLRRRPRPLPPGADRAGARRARPDLVSASAADAGLLAVPDRLDGHRPDQRDLPGALHALPAASRPARRHDSGRSSAVSGASSATARWTSPSRSPRSRSRRASSSTTAPSSSTATCSASTGRCAATAASSTSSSRCSPAPAGTSIKCLWRSDWDVLFARDHGHALMRAFAQTVDGQFQTLSAKDGAFNREVFFGQNDGAAARSSPTCATRTSIACAAAATTRSRSTPPSPPRSRTPASRRSCSPRR